MNIQQISELPHVLVTDRDYCYEVEVDSGYYMTSQQGDDFVDYIAYQHSFFPKAEKYADFVIINEEEHRQNVKKQEEQINEL